MVGEAFKLPVIREASNPFPVIQLSEIKQRRFRLIERCQSCAHFRENKKCEWGEMVNALDGPDGGWRGCSCPKGVIDTADERPA